MKKSIKILASLLLIFMALTLFGCGTDNTDSGNGLSYDGDLLITGLDEEISIPFNDIYAMDTVTETLSSITSDGETIETEVTGVKLNAILADYSYSEEDFSVIRLIAGDGYAIDVPQEMLQNTDMILAYEIFGEKIGDKKMPLKSAIGDVRSMYWVNNLVEIQMNPKDANIVNEDSATESENTEAASKVVILETANRDLEKHDYTYYESVDESVKVTDLFTGFVANTAEDVYFVATDEFEKSETLEILNQGYIKTTGENAPLFISPDLPKGMQVKNILTLSCGDTTIISAASAINTLTSKTIIEQEGAALDEVIAASGLVGDYYVFTAADGYSVEVTKASLNEGILYEREPGVYQVKFSDVLDKSTSVKDILSIEIGTGENVVLSTLDGAESANEEVVPTADQATTAWTITFDGLSDGSFELSSDKANSKFDLVTIEATKVKKDGSEELQTWQGYKLLDVLNWLHVEDYTALTVVAGDGYEIELTKDMIDDETILGINVNGEILTDETNLVQLVVKNQPGNTWMKGVAQIIVK